MEWVVGSLPRIHFFFLLKLVQQLGAGEDYNSCSFPGIVPVSPIDLEVEWRENSEHADTVSGSIAQGVVIHCLSF